jgi:hypothetical protein
MPELLHEFPVADDSFPDGPDLLMGVGVLESLVSNMEIYYFCYNMVK